METLTAETITPNTQHLTPNTFSRFAEVAETVGATTKRLEKAAALAAYFDTLSDNDLQLAARYFAGYTFSLRDQRTTSVGGAALLAAIVAVTGKEDTELRARIVALGDLGDVAGEAFADSPQAGIAPTLRLADVAQFLETLAATSGTKNKIALVTGILAKAAALEAKYLVKLLGGDLRVGLQEGAVEDAVARWVKIEVGKVQWANMLLGDIGETARRARHGELDTAKMRLFHPIKFMLATAAADLADVKRQMPGEFIVEDKFDGIRAQAHIAPNVLTDEPLHGVVTDGVRVALFSRTLDEITPSFPDLVAPLAALLPPDVPHTEGAGWILDGEIVPVQGERILPFQILQQRLGRKTLTPEILNALPVAFVAYDALYADCSILLSEPLSVRRAALETLPIDVGGTVRRAESLHFADVEPLDAEFAAARARGNEGLMVKDPASVYKPGRRGRDWLKIKRALATLDVVVTAVEVGNGRRHTVLSDYTFAVRTSDTDPTLLNVGKAYSGLTDAEIAELSEWFRAHTLQEFAHGKVRVVEPQIVLEVTFDRVQPSKRHKSGYALRFPRILRIRTDKPPTEVDTLEAVQRLAESESMGASEETDG
jgi:DNA ligase 1